MRIPFALSSYQARASTVSDQRLVNAYTEVTPEGSKTQVPVYGTPGIKAFTTVGTGPIRGGAIYKGMAYVVSDQDLYRVNEAGAATLIGRVAGSDRCLFAAGDHLLILSDGNLHYYDGTTLALVDDPDFKGASTLAWLGGYYIYPKPDTGVFYVSNVEAPNEIEPLNYATAEYLPDSIVSVSVDHNDLIIFGETSTEIWNQRGGDFPFLRVANGVLEIGCIAPHSPAKVDNTVYWLANDKTIRALRGTTPELVSTAAMSKDFENYSKLDDAFGMSMTIDGRVTYVITFPTAGKTWQLSANTGLWNELESFDSAGRWKVDGYLSVYNKNLVWDYTTNKIGELDTDTYDEWGDALVYLIRSAPVAEGNKWLFHSNLFLDFETGGPSQTDAISSAERDALVMIRWSDDGGKTWGTTHTRSLGRIGEFAQRVSMNQSLGRSKNRVYEVSISDSVYRRFVGAEGDIQLGGY
tara:strand:+ start:620 stop:2017 length:1398 start_codon:yes stop_codon:yes gene_type:complete